MNVTGEYEGLCRPETAVHSLFCELCCLEMLESEGEI